MNDDIKYRILIRLSDTLDLAKIQEEFPHLGSGDLRSLFLELARSFKPVDALLIFTDGASRGNPGHAGIGAVIKSGDGRTLREIKKYVGKTTNNVAEYTALIYALHEAAGMRASVIKIYADSELLVKQINGQYAVKSEGLKPLYNKVIAALKGFSRHDIFHIERAKNKEADRLANEAIDEACYRAS